MQGTSSAGISRQVQHLAMMTMMPLRTLTTQHLRFILPLLPTQHLASMAWSLAPTVLLPQQATARMGLYLSWLDRALQRLSARQQLWALLLLVVLMQFQQLDVLPTNISPRSKRCSWTTTRLSLLPPIVHKLMIQAQVWRIQAAKSLSLSLPLLLRRQRAARRSHAHVVHIVGQRMRSLQKISLCPRAAKTLEKRVHLAIELMPLRSRLRHDATELANESQLKFSVLLKGTQHGAATTMRKDHLAIVQVTKMGELVAPAADAIVLAPTKLAKSSYP
jgi:hypothetical protein